MELVLVSACLLGSPVRYNGSDASPGGSLLDQWIQDGRVVSVCPEVAAGMPVPRPPAEIERGMGGLLVLSADARVHEDSGRDVTKEFVSGAQFALRIATERRIKIAVLKEGSPSCGSNFTYDGSFSGKEVSQPGVTAALLRKAGLYVFSESQLSEAAEAIECLEAASAANRSFDTDTQRHCAAKRAGERTPRGVALQF